MSGGGDADIRPRPCPPGPFPDAWSIEHPTPFACGHTVGDAGISTTVDHVSNVTFVAWLDRVAELHADAIGLTRARMRAENRMFFVARHEVDYRAEAHRGDELLHLTWVRDVARVKSWRETRIVRPNDQAVIVSAATLWVYVDLERRRPVRIPEAAVTALEPLTVRSPCTSR